MPPATGEAAIHSVDREKTSAVLERIGLTTAPAIDLEGLSVVYRAWCLGVPFDNAAKLIALKTGKPGNLPGIDANEFFANFLEHGIGGTCWPSSNALFSILIDLGFNARRAAGSMRDTGIVSHGSTKVRLDGSDWLVDSSMLTMKPLPLGEDLYIVSDGLWSAEVEFVDDTHVIWWDSIPAPEYIPCRLLMDDVPHEFYVERFEASRERSPFNERIYVRRNAAESILVIAGNRRFFKTSSGVDATLLTKPALEESLRSEAGFSGNVIDRLRDCGAIDASMIPPEGPPPPATRPRPSKRAANLQNLQ